MSGEETKDVGKESLERESSALSPHLSAGKDTTWVSDTISISGASLLRGGLAKA